jgi:hypothetical protein
MRSTAKRYDDHKRECRKLERAPDVGEDERADRRLLLVGHAEVAAQDPGCPAPVLDDERPIDAELVIEGYDGLLRGEGSENRPSGVAGEHLTGEEDDQA